MLKAIQENNQMSQQLEKLELKSQSQRDILKIKQTNNISKLAHDLQRANSNETKMEEELKHYKQIYRELTQKFNQEKTNQIRRENQQEEEKSELMEVAK